MVTKKDKILKDWYSGINNIMELAKKHKVAYTYAYTVIKREMYLQEFRKRFLMNMSGKIWKKNMLKRSV